LQRRMRFTERVAAAQSKASMPSSPPHIVLLTREPVRSAGGARKHIAEYPPLVVGDAPHASDRPNVVSETTPLVWRNKALYRYRP
jgi:hypothetical protein